VERAPATTLFHAFWKRDLSSPNACSTKNVSTYGCARIILSITKLSWFGQIQETTKMEDANNDEDQASRGSIQSDVENDGTSNRSLDGGPGPASEVVDKQAQS
jgi:hypothetical protein